MSSKPYRLSTLLLLPLLARSFPCPPPLIPRQLLSQSVIYPTSTTPVTSTHIASTFSLDPNLAAADPDGSHPLLLLPPNPPFPSLPTSSTPSPSVSTPDPTPPPPLSSNPNANANPTPPSSDQPLLMAYYPAWAANRFPPEKIDFTRFDWIDFAFAVPDQSLALSWDGSDDAPDLLRRLVACAHQSGKRVKLSIGGWTGSGYFSVAVSTPQNQLTLAHNILALYLQYGLDGIDLDWEYPAQAGADGNVVSADDTARFLAFLVVLRATLPPGATITAAVQTVPFAGVYGEALGDVSAFAGVLDWILLMNYDAWGSSSEPGPNAPLSDACNNSTQPGANALAALRAWTAAGFPARQLVLGVPSYGYVSRSTATVLQTRGADRTRSGRRHLLVDHRSGRGARRMAERAGLGLGLGLGRRGGGRARQVLDWVSAVVQRPPGFGPVLVANEDGGTDDGQVQFRELVDQGVLVAYTPAPSEQGGSSSGSAPGSANTTTATAMFGGGNGFERAWDACSSTPFLHSGGARQVVTYDDPVSLEMKAGLVRAAGMRGVNMFDVHGDTDGGHLAEGLARGLGLLG